MRRPQPPDVAIIRPSSVARRSSFRAINGAHPAWRTEWWRLTGWLRCLDGPHRGEPLGVQVTFFRSRTRHDAANLGSCCPNRCAARARARWPARARPAAARAARRARGSGRASALPARHRRARRMRSLM
ncbi:MAG: hypothetical protein KF786_14260 [Burkholderiaceae bacterium]|nr:hypothetical protein [Burkholderiaceae bacterium]